MFLHQALMMTLDLSSIFGVYEVSKVVVYLSRFFFGIGFKISKLQLKEVKVEEFLSGVP